MASEDEVRLVARLLAGDAGAIEQFISEYRRFIYAILTRHLGLPAAEAEEVFQRFLVHIWEDDFRRLRYWTGKAALRAYLGKIARNLAHDYRRERRLNSQSDYPGQVIENEQLQNAEKRRLLETAMSKLLSRDRELIYRRHYLEQSYREIAEALGITTNNVGVALSRAESRLRRILLEKYPGLLDEM